MVKLKNAIQNMLDDDASLEALDTAFEKLYKKAEEKAKGKNGEVNNELLNLYLEELLYDELKSTFIDPKAILERQRQLSDWEEFNDHPEAAVLLIKVLNRVVKDQQIEIRKLLHTLHKGLSTGIRILNDELENLESSNDSNLSKDKDKKIELLKTALGSESAWSKKKTSLKDVTFVNLSRHIEEKIDSREPITAKDFDDIHTKFNYLVTDKVVNPIKKYDEYRGFIGRFTEWVSDTKKKIFGDHHLSTKAVLNRVTKDSTTLFRVGKRKYAALVSEEKVAQKKKKM